MSDRRHVISAEGVVFGYSPDAPVLHGVGMTASAGKLLCILGPNGSGKTTLLRCLLGLLRPQRGRVMLDGREIRKYSRRGLARMLAYVPQFPASAFSFTVRQIVLMGRFAHGGPMGLAGRDDRRVAHLAMEMTATSRFADRTLDELSGGEAQCVMIARALAQQPTVMLLDEPTSHLDVKNQLKIYRMMRRLADEWRMAVVCVSHDVNLAARFADEMLLMREGRIGADGTPRQVIRRDVLGETYGVEIDLVEVPGQDVPLVRAR